MKIDELFEMLPEKFNAAAAVGLNKTLQWNIIGEDAGVWAFQIADGVGKVIAGGVEQPDATFTVTAKDWLAIAEGKLDSMRAFMTGKLKVNGDMSLALKVPEFFPVSF
ncbi:SCP2 sterol-binding domain-containing protein [Chloroflexia bacterium SDU3-3]|nr:SCP2 sterol-binding domain-containing protein [Chloroflexia bacterium SDU3-3]